MKLHIFSTEGEAAGAAASMIADQLRVKAESVLGLPTGRTSHGIYAALVQLHDAGRADFSRAHTLNLDEFAGLSMRSRGSYRAFMESHLFRFVNLPNDHIHFLDGRAADLDAECTRYERLIDQLGGIDLMLLGVGANGHIGFNEPRAALHARTHRARLTLATRRSNAQLFGGRLNDVPREALSMGMATILEAASIVLVALGRSKAKAVDSMFAGGIATTSPVSFLQLHPEVEAIVDQAAATLLAKRLSD